MRDVRAALEGKPLPCQSFVTILAGKTLPPTIGAAGDLAGLGGRGRRPSANVQP